MLLRGVVLKLVGLPALPPHCPDVWQDLAQDYSLWVVECIPHLQLFVGTRGGLVLHDHLELINPACQLSSIQP
jgi:hypothetical protein